MMESLRRSYDKIIIDSPPVLPVTDALIVSSRADAALLVIRHGRTRRSQTAAAVDALRGHPAALAHAQLPACRQWTGTQPHEAGNTSGLRARTDHGTGRRQFEWRYRLDPPGRSRNGSGLTWLQHPHWIAQPDR
jgi:hypothetical protein